MKIIGKRQMRTISDSPDAQGLMVQPVATTIKLEPIRRQTFAEPDRQAVHDAAIKAVELGRPAQVSNENAQSGRPATSYSGRNFPGLVLALAR